MPNTSSSESFAKIPATFFMFLIGLILAWLAYTTLNPMITSLNSNGFMPIWQVAANAMLIITCMAMAVIPPFVVLSKT